MLTRKQRHRLLVGTVAATAGAAALGTAYSALSPVAHAAAASVPRPSAETVAYDAGAARWLNAPRTVEMSQGVTFNQGGATLSTAAAVVALDNQQRALNAKSDTQVHLTDPQNDLTGAHGYVDFTRHLATLTGNVVLVVKPGKPAPSASLRAQFKDAATLTCDKMTYDYRTKIGRVPGPLTVRQKDRTLTADTGEYDTRAQVVTLTGNVHGHNGSGDIAAPLVKMGVREGDEYISIPGPNVHGVFAVPPEDADLLPNAPASSAPPPPTKSPAPAASPAPTSASAPPPGQ